MIAPLRRTAALSDVRSLLFWGRGLCCDVKWSHTAAHLQSRGPLSRNHRARVVCSAFGPAHLPRPLNAHKHEQVVRPVYVSERVNHCVWYLHLRQRADHCSSCLFHINSLSHTLTPLILLLLLAAKADTHTHTHTHTHTRTHAHVHTVDRWQALPLPHLTANGFIRSSVLIGWLWGDAR